MNIWAYSDNFEPNAVPEPAMFTIWGLRTLGCAVAAYRRKRLAAETL